MVDNKRTQPREEWMSLDEAMTRARPRRPSDDELKRDPSWYVSGRKSKVRTTKVTKAKVNYREWLEVFKGLCENPERIYDYKDKFNPEFWEERTKAHDEPSKLIQFSIGVPDHMTFNVQYDCSDEEMREWFEENIFGEGGYEQPEEYLRPYREKWIDGSYGEEIRKAEENGLWWIINWFGGKRRDWRGYEDGEMDECYLHKIRVLPEDFNNGRARFEFDDCGFTFPKGDKYDVERIEELKRIMYKLAGNQNVNSFDFSHDFVIAAPSYERTREQ